MVYTPVLPSGRLMLYSGGAFLAWARATTESSVTDVSSAVPQGHGVHVLTVRVPPIGAWAFFRLPKGQPESPVD